jgi:hexosaminidase
MFKLSAHRALHSLEVDLNARTVPHFCHVAKARSAYLVWAARKKKNWDDFVRRMKVHFGRLELLGVNYSRCFFDVRSSFSGGYVSLSCADRAAHIKYTRDGSDQARSLLRLQKLGRGPL